MSDETPSTTGSPERRPDLAFKEVPHDNSLIFTSPERAAEVDRVYRALESPTSGEFRRKIGPEECARLREVMFTADADGVSREPADGESFSPESLPGFSDGDWPPWLALELERHLPAAILRGFAICEYSFVSGPFLRIDAKHRAAILKALADSGLMVEERDDVLVTRGGCADCYSQTQEIDMQNFHETRSNQVALRLDRYGVPVATTEGVIEIEIDIDAIAKRMGRRALLAKGKRCVNGFVTVKARSFVEKPVPTSVAAE